MGKASCHVDKARFLSLCEAADKWAGRSWRVRSKTPSADAKKADGARLEALRSPRPPELTGRVACDQDAPPCLKLMLVILEMMAIIRWSQDSSSGEEKAGEVRKMFKSLGMESEWHRMVMPSCICR